MAQNVVQDRTARRFLDWGVVSSLSRARQLGVRLGRDGRRLAVVVSRGCGLDRVTVYIFSLQLYAV